MTMVSALRQQPYSEFMHWIKK